MGRGYTGHMRWNPYINGLGAAAYVWAIGLLISYISSLHHDTPDNLAGSVSALSLLVFSAAVMATLFFYRPVTLLLENKKQESLAFLLKTIGTFGVLTLAAVVTIL